MDHPDGTSSISLSDTAYRILREAIIKNVLGPGYFASEREVAERFGLSRTPTREALLRLRDEGLVEVQARRGMRVLPLSLKDVREIHAVARALELEAALALTEQPSEEVFADIEAHVTAMEKAIASEDRDAWVQADRRFHIGIVASSRNDRLIQSYGALRVLTDRARLLVLHIRPLPERSTEEHRAMLTAMRSGSTAEVMRLYRSHWQRTTDEMIRIIESINRVRLADADETEAFVP